jgi:hypothetical protein
MTPPPPAEPIRPVGPLAGGSYVARTARTEQVARRRPRGEQDDDGHASSHEHPAEGDDEGQLQRPPTPIRDPRGYDDHGRHPDDDAPGRPHVDATA